MKIEVKAKIKNREHSKILTIEQIMELGKYNIVAMMHCSKCPNYINERGFELVCKGACVNKIAPDVKLEFEIAEDKICG